MTEFDGGYQTRGERYVYAVGEKEAVAEFSGMLREVYAKLDEMSAFAEKHGFSWNFHPWLEKDENGEYKVPSNFDTEVRVSVEIDDAWMSSTQDC